MSEFKMKAQTYQNPYGSDEIEIRFGTDAVNYKPGASSVSPLLTHETTCKLVSIINTHEDSKLLAKKIMTENLSDPVVIAFLKEVAKDILRVAT